MITKNQKHIIITTKLIKIKITGVEAEREHIATFVVADSIFHQTVLIRIVSTNQSHQMYSSKIQLNQKWVRKLKNKTAITPITKWDSVVCRSKVIVL